ESSTLQKARRIARQCVREGRACRATAAANGALRHESVVVRPSEYRLSHHLRPQLLQRAVFSRSRASRSALDTEYRGDLPQGTTRGLASPRPRERSGHDAKWASTKKPPGTSAVDPHTHGALGRTGWTADGSTDRAHSVGETASGDGLSLVPGHHPTRRSVLVNPYG